MSIEVEKEENGNDIYSHLIDLCFLELDYMVLNEHFRNQMDSHSSPNTLINQVL